MRRKYDDDPAAPGEPGAGGGGGPAAYAAQKIKGNQVAPEPAAS